MENNNTPLPDKSDRSPLNIYRWVKEEKRLPEKEGWYVVRIADGNYLAAYCYFKNGSFEDAMPDGIEWLEEIPASQLRDIVKEYEGKDLEVSKGEPQPSTSVATLACTSSNSIRQTLEDALLGLGSAKAIIDETEAMQIETADNGAKLDCYQNLIDAILSIKKFQTNTAKKH